MTATAQRGPTEEIVHRLLSMTETQALDDVMAAARKQDALRAELIAALQMYVDCDGYDDAIKQQARDVLAKAGA